MVQLNRSGYLNKQAAAEKLVEAVQRILAGGRFVGPALAHKLVEEVYRGTDRPAHAALSERERQVCELSALGKSVKEIAAELALSAKTISTFRSRGFEKLGVRNDVELVHYLREHGLGNSADGLAH